MIFFYPLFKAGVEEIFSAEPVEVAETVACPHGMNEIYGSINAGERLPEFWGAKSVTFDDFRML